MTSEKRDKLESFIREQTLGPGAIGYRYVDTQNVELLSQNLRLASPTAYTKELVNNAPGALYSTAILFPVDASQTASAETDPDPISENDSDVNGSHEHVTDDHDSEEDSLSINQMYPNAMGLTCSLDEQLKNFDELSIAVRARYYSKIPTSDLAGRYGVLLEQNCETFSSFINSLDEDDPIRQNLLIQQIGQNTVLTYSAIDSEDVGNLKARLREIDKQKATLLGTEISGQYLSGFKEYLFNELRYSITENEKRVEIANTIKSIESAECSIAHLNDLLSIFDSRGYGLWECKILEKEVAVPINIPDDFRGKLVFSYKKYPELNEVFKFNLEDEEHASLSMNLQISKDSRRQKNNLFLKAQLVNTSTEFTTTEEDARYFSVFNEVVNRKSFFGVNLSVTSTHLLPYRKAEVPTNQKEFNEDEVTESLYAQYKDFAIGHGTSVTWDKKNNTATTEYLPSFDTPDIDPTPRLKEVIIEKEGKYEPDSVFKDSRFLQFKTLSNFSNASDQEITDGLKAFVDAYGNWIEYKQKAFDNTEFSGVAKQELDKCRKDKDRMLVNIDSLLANPKNKDHLLSFRLMNGAMFMQLWHSVKVKNEGLEPYLVDDFTLFDEEFYKQREDDLFVPGVPAAWRPFQLAFILLNLDGILQREDDPAWAIRNEWVDLVWFPTGGGKTEAYLGIIALTIIHRRKTYGETGGGTAVLMRYTLRLLTLQQFQRATLLIMALELLRRWQKYELGAEPIYIGLWVGQGSLPNNLAELEEEYKKIQAAQNNNSQNHSTKIPFDKCPWCGSRLNPIRVGLITDRTQVYDYNRVHLKCSSTDNKCSFSPPRNKRFRRQDHGPLPVSLCDEEIYQHPPALLFGTVDKFAQLAHKVSSDSQNRHKDSRRMFGTGNWENGKPTNGYLTPDLIIQDELHLLLGPLGSSVGLFESAIDQLCTREHNGKQLRPKVISSTATTRNTELQIMALFDRKLNVFPKPGIECDDSFYAFYKREFEDANGASCIYHSNRKYLGILPTGRTQMWMQMRLSAILMVHRAVFESEKLGENGFPAITEYEKGLASAQDNYHTMLTYFNSLREVGKTESQINTYIIKEIRRVFNRVLRPGKMMHSLYTYALNSGELTGRLSGEEVKNELDRVSLTWEPQNRFAHLDSTGKKIKGSSPPDIVVATNMISVGIDVSRFNAIIMNSMPRNLAEYIQASSRVARNTRGIVLTVHHPFRARDISHYEKFIEFHEKMYSYVEPISITPFTQKAVDRYLSLYFATMLRHRTEFTNRVSAPSISSKTETEIEALLTQLANYFLERELKLASNNVAPILKNLLNKKNVAYIKDKLKTAIEEWAIRADEIRGENKQLVFNKKAKKSNPEQEQLYVDIGEYEANIHSHSWQIPQSLRVIEPEAVIKIKSK